MLGGAGIDPNYLSMPGGSGVGPGCTPGSIYAKLLIYVWNPNYLSMFGGSGVGPDNTPGNIYAKLFISARGHEGCVRICCFAAEFWMCHALPGVVCLPCVSSMLNYLSMPDLLL